MTPCAASSPGNDVISIGNVVGSKICNIALILGLCALTPLTAPHRPSAGKAPLFAGYTTWLLMRADA